MAQGFVGQTSQGPQVNIAKPSQDDQNQAHIQDQGIPNQSQVKNQNQGIPNQGQVHNQNQGAYIQNQDQLNSSYQGPSYQVVGTFSSNTPNDDILNRLHEMEKNLNNQGKSRVSYGSICNKPIHPSIPIKDFPYKFEVPKMDKFKGKEDPQEHLHQFKYYCNIIASDDILMLRIFTMILPGQALDWYNNLVQYNIFSFE